MGSWSGPTGPASSHLPDFPRGNFTVDLKVVFPEGGMATADTKPLIELLLKDYPFCEKLTGYIDIGQTDAVKDLDVVDDSVMVPVYMDPQYMSKFPPTNEKYSGRNPPKFILLRCLAGSGLLYMNVKDFSGGIPQPQLIAPLPLHAGKGLFMYAFPRLDPHYVMATPPGEPAALPYPLVMLDLFLRTLEPGNRFQLMVLR
jgi:hypothetical protein